MPYKISESRFCPTILFLSCSLALLFSCSLPLFLSSISSFLSILSLSISSLPLLSSLIPSLSLFSLSSAFFHVPLISVGVILHCNTIRSDCIFIFRSSSSIFNFSIISYFANLFDLIPTYFIFDYFQLWTTFLIIFQPVELSIISNFSFDLILVTVNCGYCVILYCTFIHVTLF